MQPAIPSLIPIGRCEFCAGSLAAAHVAGCKEYLGQAEWNTWAIGKMISVSSSQKVCLSTKYFVQGLKSYADYNFGGNIFALAREVGFAGHTIAQWVRGRYKPRLDMFLLLCYRLGVDPVSLVTGQSVQGQIAVSIKRTDGGNKIRKKHNSDEMLARLSELAIVEPPISFREAARRLEVGTSYLRYNFPEIARKITNRWQQAQKCAVLQRKERLHAQVVNTIEYLRAKGLYPSLRLVVSHCKPCSNEDFMRYWKMEMTRLGYRA